MTEESKPVLLFTAGRANARVESTSASASVTAIGYCEHITPGRPRSLRIRTDGELLPGAVYRLRTNARYSYTFLPGQLHVRAKSDLWDACGMEVLRIEASPELVLDVRVAGPVKFDTNIFVFEVSLVSPIGLGLLPADIVLPPEAGQRIATGVEKKMAEPARPGGAAAAAPQRAADPAHIPTPNEFKDYWNSVPIGETKTEG